MIPLDEDDLLMLYRYQSEPDTYKRKEIWLRGWRVMLARHLHVSISEVAK